MAILNMAMAYSRERHRKREKKRQHWALPLAPFLSLSLSSVGLLLTAAALITSNSRLPLLTVLGLMWWSLVLYAYIYIQASLGLVLIGHLSTSIGSHSHNIVQIHPSYQCFVGLTVFCIMFVHIRSECGESFASYRRSHMTVSWIWIMLCWSCIAYKIMLCYLKHRYHSAPQHL